MFFISKIGIFKFFLTHSDRISFGFIFITGTLAAPTESRAISHYHTIFLRHVAAYRQTGQRLVVRHFPYSKGA